MQGKGNFKKETKSLLIAAQYNAISTNHIKACLDKMQQNSKCRLCGHKTINHIIIECSKLAQKENKTRHNWVGKGNSLGEVQEIWPYKQMVYAQSRICPWEWDAQTLLGFWDTNGSLNLSQTTGPYNDKKRELADLWTFLPQLTTE